MINFIIGSIMGFCVAGLLVVILGRGQTWKEEPEKDEFKEDLLRFWRQSISLQTGSLAAFESIANELNRMNVLFDDKERTRNIT